jgi:uroporphyrinogen-III synthase
MRLLVTRPEPDAAETAARLRAMGHDVIVRPMLAVVFNPPPAGLAPDSLVLTSRNAVRALASWPDAAKWRGLPTFAVGAETGALLQEHGFRDIRTAGGDAGALIALIESHAPAELGTILYPAPRDQAADLAARLGAKGYRVERVEAYRAESARELGDELTQALRAGRLDGALFFSERTASAFVALVGAARLQDSLRPLAFYALSRRTAAPLRNLAGELHVAGKPDSASLFALLPGAVKP